MITLIVILIVFGIILCCTQILKSKPVWLVKLYVDIWQRPFPTKGSIEVTGIIIFVIAYFLVMIYVAFFDK